MASNEHKREAKQSPKVHPPRRGQRGSAAAPAAIAPSPKTRNKTAAPARASATSAVAPPGGDTWSESASFIVYVERKLNNGVEECRTVARRRTAVHHMETGESQIWPGVALDECARWMQEHLVQAAASASTSAVDDRASGGIARLGEAPHAIDGVWLAQGLARAKEALLKNGHGRATWIDCGQPWRLDFMLSEPRMSNRTVSARIRVDAVNRVTDKRVQVGSAEVVPCAPAAWGAVVRVPAGQLQVGSYALECRVEADAVVLGRLRLPLLEACASVLPPTRSASESDVYALHKQRNPRPLIAAD